MSVDTGPGCLTLGIPEVDDNRKSIKMLLGKRYNSRWKRPFVEDGSVCWSKNLELIVQEREDDWTYVGQKVVESWQK